MAFANPNYTAILATTIEHMEDFLQDNITDNDITLKLLKEHGAIREVDGGESLVEQIIHEENSTVKSYNDLDLLDISPQEGISAARYTWKQVSGAVQISGRERMQNRGREQIVDLMEGKMTQLLLSYDLEFETQILGDGTGNGGKDLTGLEVLVEDGTAWGTVGGIDSSTAANAFWRNGFIDFTGAGYTSFLTAAGPTYEGIQAVRNLINTVKRGKDKPHLLLTSQEVYEDYAATLDDPTRFIDKTIAGYGYEGMTLDGVPMVYSDGVNSDDLWALNFNYLKLKIMAGRNFEPSEFKEPINQDSLVSTVKWMGNFSMSNRKRQGRIINLA